MFRVLIAALRAVADWLERFDTTPDRTRLLARFAALERKADGK